MFHSVIISGMVSLVAIAVGTPTSPKSKLGSGDMTVLLEKSTRFPDSDPLKRPSLPLSLCVKVFFFYQSLVNTKCRKGHSLVFPEPIVF